MRKKKHDIYAFGFILLVLNSFIMILASLYGANCFAEDACGLPGVVGMIFYLVYIILSMTLCVAILSKEK